MITLGILTQKALSFSSRIKELFDADLLYLANTAQKVKTKRPLSFFAPLYVSSVCGANCPYCGFRKGSKIERRTLTFEEACQEVQYLKEQQMQEVYCLSGSFREGSIAQAKSMTEVNARGIRAIAEAGLFPVLESSPFSESSFRELIEIAHGKARFVLFQECYNREKYLELHSNDQFKGDPDQRLQQHELAFKAGWKEFGIGMLIGLHDDLMGEVAHLVAYYFYLKNELGAEKVTISIPRINTATEALVTDRARDEEFLKVVYIIRILCPDSYIVITGRESEQIRDTLKPVTDIWGIRGSTVPGGYTLGGNEKDGQFALNDRRSVKEILQ